MQDNLFPATSAASAGANTLIFLIGSVLVLALMLSTFVALWKVYTKAGQPGWASLIPFYNTYVMLKIVGRPGWWLLLLFIPIINIIFTVIVVLDLAKVFGKSAIFGIFGLLIFTYIGFMMLAFGKAQYQAPGGAALPPVTPPETPATPMPTAV